MVCGIDAWDLAAQTFKDNFTTAVVETRALGPRSLPLKDLHEGMVDLLLASPECTNHSPAKGSKPRCEHSRNTSRYVLNFAKKLKPRWIVLENVVQLRNWWGYHPLLDDLRRLGYNVSPQVLQAADYGVPQTRRRLFVLCDRDREPPLVKPRCERRRTACDAIQIDGPWLSTPLYRPGRAPPTLKRAERAISTLGKFVPFLIVYYGSDGSGGWQRLDRPLRTLTTLDRFGLVTYHGSSCREPCFRPTCIDDGAYCIDLLRNGSSSDSGGEVTQQRDPSSEHCDVPFRLRLRTRRDGKPIERHSSS